MISSNVTRTAYELRALGTSDPGWTAPRERFSRSLLGNAVIVWNVERCNECGLYSFHPGTCSVIAAKPRGMAIKALPWPERFWSRIENVNGCWEWQGARHLDGYGHIQLYDARTGKKRPIGTHRVAWELLVGPIPDGLLFDHLCRNTRCANPTHLELVSQRENVLRSESPAGVNSRRTHCVHGHDLSDLANVYLYPYKRACKICIMERYQRYRREGRG
jgi:hypothetical protein